VFVIELWQIEIPEATDRDKYVDSKLREYQEQRGEEWQLRTGTALSINVNDRLRIP
jgi:hypothetical protein